MTREHEGRIAVVTGAGRGIGRTYAEDLAAAGATVVVADRDDGSAAETTSEIERAGGRAITHHVDVGDEASTTALGTFVRDTFGAAHILINNAAIYHSMRNDPQLEVDLDYWRTMFAVNLDGALLMTRAIAPLMIEQGWGRVVNQTSTAAYSGLGGAYAVSKLALIGLTQGFARELGPHGITVNAVAPGLIATEATAVTVPEQARQHLVNQQSIPREGGPADLLAAVRFLCSDGAAWTSGQVVVVDGFKTLRI